MWNDNRNTFGEWVCEIVWGLKKKQQQQGNKSPNVSCQINKTINCWEVKYLKFELNYMQYGIPLSNIKISSL